MNAEKIYVACFWGAATFWLLCYGITNRSTNALLLVAALTPSLVVFIWWMIDRTSLERRIRRLEARSEIAAEKRAVMQTDLVEVDHKLDAVKARVDNAEKNKSLAYNLQANAREGL
jgi:hypothetical protein